MRYRRATGIADAIAQLGDGAVPLAGGTVIVPEAVRRGEGPDVVDISRIEALHELTMRPAVGPIARPITRPIVRIGAMVTLARLARLARVTDAPELAGLTALGAAAAEVGNPHVRLRGTLGGNLGYRAPYPNLPPALIALDATAVLADAGGERAITVEELVRTGPPAGALIVRIEIEIAGDAARSAFRKFAWRRSSGRTLVTVAVGGTPARPRVAVGGLCRHAVRLPGVEALLAGRAWTPDLVREAAARAAGEAPADVAEFPPPIYRRRLVAAGIRRALDEIAGGPP
jgi:CO/xanthine dehydrogenase FAD-binding subunit